MTYSTTCLRDHFLIAMPNMADSNFHRTVTYICEHTEDGALGITINQPSNVTFDDVIAHMEITNATPDATPLPVMYGGPVQTERGFVIHSPIGQWGASLPVNDNLAVTASRDIIEAIAGDRGPEQILICLGYAGWDAGQLEAELSNNMWLEGPASSEIIFNTPFEKRWEAAAKLLGVDFTFFSGDAGHA